MPIHIIRTKATPKQMEEMLLAHKYFIKLAVDVRERMIAGGGAMHADCEAMLLREGCEQDDIWGADWVPDLNEVEYRSFINIRPGQQNMSALIENEGRRQIVETIVRERLTP